MILYWTGWDIYSKMLIGIILGLVVMLGARLRRKEQKHPLDLRHSTWAFAYIFGIGLISYLGQFGGGIHLIAKNHDICFFIQLVDANIMALPFKMRQKQGAMKQGRGTCGMLQSFNLTYLNVLRS